MDRAAHLWHIFTVPAALGTLVAYFHCACCITQLMKDLVHARERLKIKRIGEGANALWCLLSGAEGRKAFGTSGPTL